MIGMRILTALFLFSVFFIITLLYSINIFIILVTGILIITLIEWSTIFKIGKKNKFLSIIYVSIIILALLASVIYSMLKLFFLYIAIFFWLFISIYIIIYKPIMIGGTWRKFFILIGPILFIACWHSLIIARINGTNFLLSILFIPWFTDISSYFIGNYFGKNKLLPTISPNKTLEGFIGGWITVIILTIFNKFIFISNNTLFSILYRYYGFVLLFIILTILVIFSILGDLFESLLKRQAGIKDSGKLLPGHGGILDRIDSILPVIPISILITKYLE